MNKFVNHILIQLDLPEFYINNDTNNNEVLPRLNSGLQISARNQPNDSYDKCLESAKNKKLSLCSEGYCTAKEKFDVYPSAYANAYASQVCNGTKPDFRGTKKNYYGGKEKPKDSKLEKWFEEEWVNVCEPNFPPCGRKSSNLSSKNYPYCRPLNKLSGTKVKTVSELTNKDIEKMCKKKQNLEQGVKGKPTRVFLDKN